MRFNFIFVFVSFFVSVVGLAQTKCTEEQYITRLASLKSPIEIVYIPAVKKYIDAYIDNPEKTRELIGLSKFYFPIIERALKAKNVPLDLKYLSVAVSELNPFSVNLNGACGIWMMGYNVSKMYKIKINSFVDDRRDPTKSSFAAASHFKDIFSIYKQWPLAIAAYGCSPVVLNKCIRMAGNSVFLGDLYPYIPEYSRDVYPKFVAALYIMNFYREHGIKPVFFDLYQETDSVLVNKWLSLQQISSTIDVPLEYLRKLNPCFKKDIIPYSVEGYWVRLPKNKGRMYFLLKDSVFSSLPSSSEFAPLIIQKENPDTLVGQSLSITKHKKNSKSENASNKKTVVYVVKRGEKLADIADLFDVNKSDILSWNNLKKSRIKSGTKLEIWVNGDKSGYYKRISKMSSKQKRVLIKKD